MAELDLLSKGLATCQGCPMELIARAALKVLGPNTVTMTPPSCAAILTGSGDETGWGIRPAARRTVTDLPGANTASRMEQARSSRGISRLGGGVGLPWGIPRTASPSRTKSPSRL